MYFAYRVGSIGDFATTLRKHLDLIQSEFGVSQFILPVGIFLVVDADNGGDAIAQEVIKRFRLLDHQSGHSIDFFYLGWVRSQNHADSGDEFVFNPDVFSRSLAALKDHGLSRFGGNADLILVDAQWFGGFALLDFERAIRIDLSKRAAKEEMATLGEFLQDIIAAAHELKDEDSAIDTSGTGAVYRISSELGILYGKESILDWILDKWGRLIGARRIKDLISRNIGPLVNLDSLADWALNDLLNRK